MNAAISAALSVVRKALSPVTDGLLESWAASAGLSPNIDALKMQLLYAQGMLDNAQGIDIRSPALKELLHKLRQLAYRADDVLDELDYFRIQDALDGTYQAADLDAQGCVDSLVLHAWNTARVAVNKLMLSSGPRDAGHGDVDDQDNGGKQGCLSVVRSCGRCEIRSLPPSPTNQGVKEIDGGCMPKVVSCARSTSRTIGKHFPCYSFSSVYDDDADSDMLETSNMSGCGQLLLCRSWLSKPLNKYNVMQTSKLKFDRVKMSKEMVEIVEQLKPLCAMVSTILDKELLGSAILKLDILGSNRTPLQDNGMSRPKSTPKIIQPDFYGRDNQIKHIVNSITHGEYCADELTVLPLVGPGGIGKTTLTQHIYSEVENCFQVSVWVCVSLDFNVNRLVKEIVKQIPRVNDEKQNASDEELIELKK
uniref:Uncharacterized protein n=1 Tax=Avena sativa TaxID=4498 RepID=A0ACD5W6K4_AVESA